MAEGDRSIKSIINSRGCLRNHLLAGRYTQIYLVTGESGAGKKTLIHYLLKKKLEPDVSEDGQEVLNILEEADKFVIVQGILELYPQQQTLYIWLNGFQSSDMQIEDSIRWNLMFQYLAHLLTTTLSKVAILVVFSLYQDLPLLMSSFRDSFKIYNKFADKTAFVLSKLADESELGQFTEITSQALIETNSELSFINQVINNNTIYPFYSWEPQEEEVNILKDKIKNLFLNEQKLQLCQEEIKEYLNNNIPKGTEEDEIKLKKILIVAQQKAAIGLQILNSFLCQILFATANEKIPQIFTSSFQINSNKFLSENQCAFQIDEDKIKQKQIRNALFEFYEKCKTIFADDATKFVVFFMKNIKEIEIFLAQATKDCNILEYIQQNWIFCSSLEQQKDLIEGKMIEIFQDPNTSFLSDVVLSNIFQKVKNHFSQKFIQSIPESVKVPKKLTGVRKTIIKKPKFEDYQIQKQKASKLSIENIFRLPISPLKLDLLLNSLKSKMKKKDACTIRQVRILIQNTIKILEVYEQYEAIIRLFLVIPDFNAIEKVLYSLCNKISQENIKKHQPVEQNILNFIEKVIKFFYANNRHTFYYLKQANEIIMTQKYSESKQSYNFQTELASIQKILPTKAFMDYGHAEEIFKFQDKIVERCLDYEDKNWQKFQQFLVLRDGLTRKCL